MNGQRILSLDFGTSAVKAALVADDGTIVAESQQTYPTVTGPSGVCEQEPELWWRAACAAVQACTGGGKGVISAAAITGQMQDVVVVGADRRALRPALLYSDLRAWREYDELAEALPDWDAQTGNAQDSASVAAKLQWLRRHEPDTLATAAALVFGPAGYIALRLGGAPACDIVTASTTGLLDAAGESWQPAVVAVLGIDPRLLPRLIHTADPGGAVVGEVDEAGAAAMGVDAGTPIVMGLGDAGSATDGLVGTAVDSSYAYLGTTGWYAKVVDALAVPIQDRYLYRLLLPGRSRALAIGGILAAGNTSRWARETFLPRLSFDDADAVATERLAGGPVSDLLCLPGLAGERSPVRNPDVRGTFVGITTETEPVDLYLAALAGVAFNLRHVADDLGGHRGPLAVAGGAASSPSWRRLLADIFASPVTTVAREFQPGIHSAARSAARAMGWPDIPPAMATTPASTVEPSPHAARYAELRPIHRDLYTALAPTFAAQSALRT